MCSTPSPPWSCRASVTSRAKALYILRGQLPSVKKRGRVETEGRGSHAPGGMLRSSQSAPVPASAPPSATGAHLPQLLRAEDLVGPGPRPAPSLVPSLVPPPQAPPLTGSTSRPEVSFAALSAAEWPKSGPFNYQQWRQAVASFVQIFTPRRGLGVQDLARLEQLAGFSLQGGGNDHSLKLPPQKWAAFGEWFLSFMHLFSFYNTLWSCTSPTAICGFGVDRVIAEASLQSQPSGTFLIRPSLSLSRTLVLSLTLDGVVKHMALEAQQLNTRMLEVWVRDVAEATHLLDIASGSRYLKNEVFLLHYRRLEPTPVEAAPNASLERMWGEEGSGGAPEGQPHTSSSSPPNT